MTASAFSVFVGLHDQLNYNSWTKQIKAEKVVNHPSYDSVRTINDISMVKLSVIEILKLLNIL